MTNVRKYVVVFSHINEHELSLQVTDFINGNDVLPVQFEYSSAAKLLKEHTNSPMLEAKVVFSVMVVYMRRSEMHEVLQHAKTQLTESDLSLLLNGNV